MSRRQQSRAGVYILGEESMVNEFGLACEKAGLTVYVAPAPRTSILPRTFTRSASIPAGVAAAFELTNTNITAKKINLRKLDSRLHPSAPILTSSVTVTATEQASWLRRPGRLIGMSALPTLLDKNLIELAPNPHSSREAMSSATALFASIGKESSIIQDRVGMVMPRILCMLINEACFALTEELASGPDIDTAMKLGTNYPAGPIEWGDRIGFDQVFAVLNAIHNDLGEERYRIAPLLRRLATTAPQD